MIPKKKFLNEQQDGLKRTFSQKLLYARDTAHFMSTLYDEVKLKTCTRIGLGRF